MSIGDLSVEEFMAQDWGDEESPNGDEELQNQELKKTKKKKKKKKLKQQLLKQAAKGEVVSAHEKTASATKLSVKTNMGTSKGGHQTQLNSLMEKDPEFYKFLQEEDASLLKFNENDLDLDASSDESESDGVHRLPDKLEEASDSDLDVASSDEEQGVPSDEEDSDGGQKRSSSKKKKELITVTEQMINSWKSRIMTTSPSVSALRDLMQAFHAALVRIDAIESDETTKGKGKRKKKSGPSATKYRVIGSATFNCVVGLCVHHVTPALAKILSYFPGKMKQTKKKKPPLPNSCARWSAVRDMLRSYLSDVVVLAQSLLEPSVVRVVMRHILLLLPFFVPFPKIAKTLLKLETLNSLLVFCVICLRATPVPRHSRCTDLTVQHLIKCWSSDDNESVRVLSFLCITRLIKMEKDRFLENAMKQAYLSYVANCKFTSPTTLPMINFMQRTFAEICSLDANYTYQFAFLYIRQLAVQLRKAMTAQNKETRQAVYNWQFVHSVALWCRVLSVLHPNETTKPLIYPLVQIALGVIDLVPTSRFYPLRFHLVRSLIALSDCTDTYIPLLPVITCPLVLQEFKKRQSGVTVRPVPFETMLKLSNSQLKEKAYRDTTVDHVYDLLMAYFNTQAHTIAFPEVCVPTVAMLKKFAKDCKTPNYCKVVKQVIEKIQENADFVTAQRSEVTFQVGDIEAVRSWESSLRNSGVPFHKHFTQYKQNRQRELVQHIADKNRNVEERLPTIDRAKFLEMDKSKDREEMGKLFGDVSEDEQIDADFERAIEEGHPKKRKRDSKALRDVSESSGDEQEEKVAPVPRKKTKRERKAASTVKADTSDDEGDIVEDFHFSDSE